MSNLPTSLKVKPNIPVPAQSVEELIAERQYWDQRIKSAGRWGAAVGVAAEFRDECDGELLRRFK